MKRYSYKTIKVDTVDEYVNAIDRGCASICYPKAIKKDLFLRFKEIKDLNDDYLFTYSRLLFDYDQEESYRLTDSLIKKGYTNACGTMMYFVTEEIGTKMDHKRILSLYEMGKDNAVAIHNFAVYEGNGLSEQEAAKLLAKAADMGYAASEWVLARRYLNGKGVSHDTKKAVELLSKAARQGYKKAQYQLGIVLTTSALYCRNEDNLKLAAHYFDSAAREGHANAQYEIGKCWYYGTGVEKNEEYAEYWFKLAAEQEVGSAYLMLGYIEEDRKNYGNAFRNYLKGADLDSSYSKYNLGRCFLKGIGTDADKEKGIKWLKIAANEGVEDAKKMLQKNTNEKPTLNDYIQRANNGDMDAMWYLEKYYFDRRQYKESEYYCRKLALLGDSMAQYNLGVLYDQGYLTAPYGESAEEWYIKAAHQGHGSAQYNLGVLYEERGNYTDALFYYGMASQQGIMDAKNAERELLDWLNGGGEDY